MSGSDQFHHGVDSFETNNGVRPISSLASNIIGLVATASDADVTKYPLDQPVLLNSISDGLDFAGEKGTLAKSLDAIRDQADTQCVIIRVAEGESEAETTANLIGSNAAGKQKGMYALLRAKQLLGVKPRILGVPEFDNASVTAEMIIVAQSLRAMVYAAAGDFDDPTEVTAYRQQFGARELMLIDDHFLGFDTVTKTTSRATTIARAMGLRAKIDQQVGFQKTISNVAVNGVTGIERCRTWELLEKNHDLNYLNSKEVTGLIQDKGFKFWGNRTTSDDPLFCFENYTRTAQMLADTIAEAHMWAIDKDMNPTLLIDTAIGIQAKIDEMTRKGRLLGGHVWVDREANPTELVKNGQFQISYDYTPVPPLERLALEQCITDSYIVNLVENVISATTQAKASS